MYFNQILLVCKTSLKVWPLITINKLHSFSQDKVIVTKACLAISKSIFTWLDGQSMLPLQQDTIYIQNATEHHDIQRNQNWPGIDLDFCVHSQLLAALPEHNFQ